MIMMTLNGDTRTISFGYFIMIHVTWV